MGGSRRNKNLFLKKGSSIRTNKTLRSGKVSLHSNGPEMGWELLGVLDHIPVFYSSVSLGREVPQMRQDPQPAHWGRRADASAVTHMCLPWLPPELPILSPEASYQLVCPSPPGPPHEGNE